MFDFTVSAPTFFVVYGIIHFKCTAAGINRIGHVTVMDPAKSRIGIGIGLVMLSAKIIKISPEVSIRRSAVKIIEQHPLLSQQK